LNRLLDEIVDEHQADLAGRELEFTIAELGNAQADSPC
jgi:hypothetical protein